MTLFNLKAGFRKVCVGILASVLVGCGGGGSGNSPSGPTLQAPTLSATFSNCNSTTCTANISVAQPNANGQQGLQTLLNLTNKASSTLIANTTVNLSAQGTGSWSVPNLTIGTSYILTGATTISGTTGPKATITITPTTAVGTVTSTCTTQMNCQSVFTFSPTLAQTLKDGSTTITLTDPNGNQLFTTTVTSTATPVTLTPTLLSNTNYTLTIAPSGGTSSSINFSPSFIYSNGVYMYNTNFDLGGTTAPFTSKWNSQFQNLTVSDLYIDTNSAYLNTGFPAAGTLSFDDYYKQYVLNGQCTNLPTTFAMNYSSYVNGDNTTFVPSSGTFSDMGSCVSQSVTDQAYATSSTWNLNNGVETRVMALIETPEILFGNGTPASNTDATTIDYLAHAVAKTIYNDQYASGVTFDVEFNDPRYSTPNAATYAVWYQFFSDLVGYMHTLAPSASEQKYLSIFANFDALTSIAASSGSSQNLFSLLSSTNTNCGGDKCYIIVPRYDFGSINYYDSTGKLNIQQSLDQLVNDGSYGPVTPTPPLSPKNVKNSFSYETASGLSYAPADDQGDPESLLYALLNNQDYFQFAFAASGSWSTTPAMYVIRAETTYPIKANDNVVFNSCPGGAPSGCSNYITQTDSNTSSGGNLVTQNDYVCDSLLAFKMVDTTEPTNSDSTLGCTYVGNNTSVSAGGPVDTLANQTQAIQKYLMGITMYQMSDQTVDWDYCQLNNRFKNTDCSISEPRDLNEMAETPTGNTLWNWSDPNTGVLHMINTWTTQAAKNFPTVTTQQ